MWVPPSPSVHCWAGPASSLWVDRLVWTARWTGGPLRIGLAHCSHDCWLARCRQVGNRELILQPNLAPRGLCILVTSFQWRGGLGDPASHLPLSHDPRCDMSPANVTIFPSPHPGILGRGGSYKFFVCCVLSLIYANLCIRKIAGSV